MYRVVFHLRVLDDLTPSFSIREIKRIVQKTEARLAAHSEPDGRVIKRLHHIVTAVFFEYKARQDWRAIFYTDRTHQEVRVLGYIPKNIGATMFDHQLESFLSHRYGGFFDRFM